MSVEDRTGIKRFNGSEGFDIWKFRLERYLASEGLDDCLFHFCHSGKFFSEADYIKRDNQAKHVIVSLLHDMALVHIKNKNSAKDMWETLNKLFA